MADLSRSSRPWPPLCELTRARMLEFVREKEAIFWVFVFPVLLALALGIAFRSRPVSAVRVAVVAEVPQGEALAALLDEAGELDATLMDAASAEAQLRHGKVDLVVVWRATGERPASLPPPPEALRFRLDPSRGEARTARLAVLQVLQRSRAGVPPLDIAQEELSEPGSRYIDFVIPGLVGLNLMGSGMWGIGFSVVVARARKLLKRFAATPMRRSDYLLSYALSRLVFLLAEVAAVVGFGWLAFGVRVHGSLLALAVVCLAGTLCFAGLGLLVAARPRTIEAVSGWMNLVMLPMWLLSGTFFSYERFPSFTHTAIRTLPLTALNDALRLVINDGAGLLATVPQLTVLGVWGGASFALAVRLFRWQ